jgi:predicted component of type VI protein secretion system
MRSSDNNRRLVSSVINRLLEGPSQGGQASSRSSGLDLRQLKLDVGRDLEDLLNTRRRSQACPPDFREVNTSVAD